MIVKTNYANVRMMLVNDANEPVSVDDEIPMADGSSYRLLGAAAPHKFYSAGHVQVVSTEYMQVREYPPSFIGCRWVAADETAHSEHIGGAK